MNGNDAIAEKRLILRNRAKALASEPREGGASCPSLDVVEIRLAGENYAVESAHVSEVLPLKELTPLPCTPEFVLGLINVRGQILSVVDLRVLFDLPRPPVAPSAKVVVLRSGPMEVGVVADVVVEARVVPLDAISPVLPSMTGLRESCTRGIVGGNVALLDVARLLAEPTILVNEQVEGGER